MLMQKVQLYFKNRINEYVNNTYIYLSTFHQALDLSENSKLLFFPWRLPFNGTAPGSMRVRNSLTNEKFKS